jgi:hypothetical protein
LPLINRWSKNILYRSVLNDRNKKAEHEITIAKAIVTNSKTLFTRIFKFTI